MLIIENLLASIDWPGSYSNLDIENNYIDDQLANCLYKRLQNSGNSLFDTYGMWHDINGFDLLNCLLSHYAQKEDYRRCKWLKVRKEQYIHLVGYFDRCRSEKLKRFMKKSSA
jgi:hypothetical protein